MKNPPFRLPIMFLARVIPTGLGLAALLLGTRATAQTQVYSQDFEVDDTLNWVVNQTSGSNIADFYFDYSSKGIPLSPNSSGGSTRALQLIANIYTNAANPAPSAGAGLSVSPIGFSITDNFEMRFDMWLNFNGPLPAGGSGSTIVAGGGFGTAGVSRQTAGAADSFYVSATCDGGSSADYRVYTPNTPTSFGDGSPVYVNVVTRNNSQAYYVTNFPSQTVPAAQLALYPQQTNSVGQAGTNAPGSAGFKWRDVSLKKLANIFTYSIDGVVIARTDMSTNGTLGGANILFNCFDINQTASIDPNYTNLNFALFDNIRITNFPSVVTVSASVPAASEAGPTAGVFTISRPEPGPAVTVNYSLSGTAVNGTDYTNDVGSALSGTVLLPLNATSVNVQINPVDDSVAEDTETVILNVENGVGYIGGGNAIMTIVDNETPVLTITNVSTQMYERTNDYAIFRVRRLGDLTTSFSVNLSYTGSGATFGSDFYDEVVSINGGEQTKDFKVFPIADAAYEGNETVQVSVGAPTNPGDYTPGAGSGTITLVDANTAAETVLFSDNFNTADSVTNWGVAFGSADPAQDYTTTFAFDYSSQNIPPAPHGSDTLGVYLQVNKDGTAAAAGLNLYSTNFSASGNYALRFDLFLNTPLGAAATEYLLFGINHSGTKTNWFRNSTGGVPAGWTFDGIFFGVEADGAALGDYAIYSSPTTGGSNPNPTSYASRNATSLGAVFKTPPYAALGVPANNLGNLGTPIWADVEVSQIGNIVSLRINQNNVFSYNNTNVNTAGYSAGQVMIGYCDAYDSIGGGDSYAIIDNLRVMSLQGLKITAIQDLGANVQLDFSFDLNDSASAFKVQTATVVTGPYADATATVVELSPGTYRATIAKPLNTDPQYYRIRHN